MRLKIGAVAQAATLSADGAQFKAYAVELRVTNTHAIEEYTGPVWVGLDLADAAILEPQGFANEVTARLRLGPSDGTLPTAVSHGGTPYWDFSSALDIESATPAARLLAGETTGPRSLTLSLHAGVREFSIPILLHATFAGVAQVIGATGGTITHPIGAAVSMPEGAFPEGVLVQIEQALWPAPPPTGRTFAGPAFEIAFIPAQTIGSGGSTVAQAVSSLARMSSQVAPTPTGDAPPEGRFQLLLPMNTAASTPATTTAGTISFAIGDEIRALGLHAAEIVVDGVRYTVTAKLRNAVQHRVLKFRAVVEHVAGDGTCASSMRQVLDQGGAPSAGMMVVFLHGWIPTAADCNMWNLPAPIGLGDERKLGVELFRHLAREAFAPNLEFWRFTYPSFRSIDTSAAELRDALARLGGHKGIILVGHSMGGLVARRAAQLGVPELRRVITLGSPHLGSPLADPTFWADAEWSLDSPLGGVVADFITLGTDGSNDLIPGSQFLHGLNATADPVQVFAFAGEVPGAAVDEHTCNKLGQFECAGLNAGFRIYAAQGVTHTDGIVMQGSAQPRAATADYPAGQISNGLYYHVTLPTGQVTAEEAYQFPDPLLERVAQRVGEALPPTASHLVFERSTPPQSQASYSKVWDPTVTVSVRNSAGELITSASDPIVLSLAVSATGAQLTGNSAIPVNGVATFPKLAVWVPTTDDNVRLRAIEPASSGVASAIGERFSVSPFAAMERRPTAMVLRDSTLFLVISNGDCCTTPSVSVVAMGVLGDFSRSIAEIPNAEARVRRSVAVDDEFVYFLAEDNATSDQVIWRAPKLGGGSAIELVRRPNIDGMELHDGMLFYSVTDGALQQTIQRMPAGGGPSSVVAQAATIGGCQGGFTLDNEYLYYSESYVSDLDARFHLVLRRVPRAGGASDVLYAAIDARCALAPFLVKNGFLYFNVSGNFSLNLYRVPVGGGNALLMGAVASPDFDVDETYLYRESFNPLEGEYLVRARLDNPTAVAVLSGGFGPLLVDDRTIYFGVPGGGGDLPFLAKRPKLFTSGLP